MRARCSLDRATHRNPRRTAIRQHVALPEPCTLLLRDFSSDFYKHPFRRTQVVNFAVSSQTELELASPDLGVRVGNAVPASLLGWVSRQSSMNHEKLFEDLKRAVAVGRVAVVAGSGVSLQVTNNAPCASWTGLLKHGARHCDLEALLTPLIDTEDVDAMHGLGGIVATTNYDDLLTRDRGLTPVPWTKHAKVMDVLYGERPGVIHLHGYFDDPESVVLGVESYTNDTHSPHPD